MSLQIPETPACTCEHDYEAHEWDVRKENYRMCLIPGCSCDGYEQTKEAE